MTRKCAMVSRVATIATTAAFATSLKKRSVKKTEKNLNRLNIVYAIADTLIAALAIVAFSFGAYHFDRWWIMLFSIIPLLLYSQHTLVINADIEAQKGGEEDAGGRNS